MYAVLLLAVLSLLLLVLQDVLIHRRARRQRTASFVRLRDGLPVFLIAGLATLIAGVAALGRRQAAIGCSADSIRSLGGCLPGGGGTRHRRHGEPAASGLNTPDPLPGFADGLLPAVLARWRGPTRGRVSNNPPRLQDIDRSTPPGTIDSSS